jgi:FimV-like protein
METSAATPESREPHVDTGEFTLDTDALDIAPPSTVPEPEAPEAQQDTPTETEMATAPEAMETGQQTQQTDAYNRVLKQQLKLAFTYFKQNDLFKSKTYIAKLINNGTDEFRQHALRLLKKIEDKQYEAMMQAEADAMSAVEPGPGMDMEDFEKTMMVTPGNNAAQETAQEVTGYHEVVPQDIYGRFIAYADNEAGSKLALAYLFLDVDETDTAKQLLEEVLESAEGKMAEKAHRLLEMLIVP